MLKNYLKIAWRNMTRNQAFSIINILGLGLGIACSLLIMLWVQDERKVDGFHANGNYLYQVYQRRTFDGKKEGDYHTQGLLAQELKRNFPEIQYASGLETNLWYTFEAGEKIYKMEGSFAGTDFFSMFSFPLLEGTAASALTSPEALAISRNMAEQFFGSAADAIGKTIRFDNKQDLKVTAVFENIPVNASQRFDFLRSWEAYTQENPWVNNWSNTSPGTIVQLRPDADPAVVETKLKDFVYRFAPRLQGLQIELGLQPYEEKYLHTQFRNGQPATGRIEYIRLFTVVSVFILLIACINFMNLATARSAKRAREVGVRKVVGALRTSLIGQFVGEAVLMTFCALLVAIVLCTMLLPLFNNITGKELYLPFNEPIFWGALVGLLLITGLVAGSYPALFLSSLKPVRVLKSSLKTGNGAGFFRRALVVFQFSLSAFLIVAMLVIDRQMHYIQTKNLGYDRENLVYIPIEGELIGRYELFKEQARNVRGVQDVSKMRNSPTFIEHHTDDIDWPGRNRDFIVNFADVVVGYDFLKTMHLQLQEGCDFSKAFGTDSVAFLLNETAVQKMGLKNPVGQSISWGQKRGTVIGVLKDFHFTSIHDPIEPLIIRVDDRWNWGTILVRVQAGMTRETVAALEKICHDLNPKYPFTYQFSDLEYTKLYRSEQVVNKLSNLFAFLAIFISCLGLFGLASFTAEQRIKEIGVRKVLGASMADIVELLASNLLKPVVIAILIAFPVAWYAMYQWLDDFAYRVKLEWWVFAVAGIITIGIALLTISFQSIKAAVMTPVASLRTE